MVNPRSVLPGRLTLCCAVACCLAAFPASSVEPRSERPIRIGLDADLSGLRAGEAIRRGIVLAIDEINREGGVLGRPLELIPRDNRGNPARGIDNIEELAGLEDLVAVIGGSFTPVALAQLDSVHDNRLVYLGPWAAGTAIVENGRRPNFVFRVSVRDEFAGGFLVDAALERGHDNLGLLLWRTAWGRSNETAMREALGRLGMEPSGIQWFNSGQQDMSAEIDALIAAGADAIMLVSGVNDGVVAIREIASRPAAERLPVISHWGITIGDLPRLVGPDLGGVDLTFLQTFSFADPPFPDRAEPVYEAYCRHFGDCVSPNRVRAAVGTAHAYDLVHLLALAITQAGTIDRGRVRDELERLGPHRGLLRDYDPPFTAERHDALDAGNFRLSRYGDDGAIIPVQAPVR